MWLPYLERVGRPFVVITRNAATVDVIAELTAAPIVVPRFSSESGDLDSVVVPSLRAAFYVQGNRANLTFQRHRRLTHVWLNHSDSDKAANFSAQHASYDDASDALITDVSSVATDYLASGKPLAVVAVRAKGQKFRQEFPIALGVVRDRA